eukprot:1044414-Rhodomonas_salina.2
MLGCFLLLASLARSLALTKPFDWSRDGGYGSTLGQCGPSGKTVFVLSDNHHERHSFGIAQQRLRQEPC